MRFRNCFVLCVTCLATTSLLADFRYQETTTITGGALVSMMKMMGRFSKDARRATEPVTSTVLVKGNRMAHIRPDNTEIIDLDKETFTQIDHQKKQYTVTTFQEMKRRLEEAERKAQEERQRQAHEGANPQESAPPPQMNFKVQVRNTGATKNVSGLDTKESILNLAMEATDQQSGQKGALAFTNDMWMAPDIPGYGEVREFNRRLAEKMGAVFGSALPRSMAAMQSGSAEGMAAMVKEMSKLSGVPVMQIMRMGVTANGEPLPAASEAPLPASNGPEMPSAGDVAKKSATSAITGRLGRFGGFGRKKSEPPPEQTTPENTQSSNQQNGVLLEVSTQATAFSSDAIDASQLEVPSGYKQVQLPDSE